MRKKSRGDIDEEINLGVREASSKVKFFIQEALIIIVSKLLEVVGTPSKITSP